MSENPGDSAGADRGVLANLHVVVPEFAGDDILALAGVRVFHSQQVFRQQLAEAPVNLANPFHRDGLARETIGVDPALHGDVGPGFELEIALARVSAVISTPC